MSYMSRIDFGWLYSLVQSHIPEPLWWLRCLPGQHLHRNRYSVLEWDCRGNKAPARSVGHVPILGQIIALEEDKTTAMDQKSAVQRLFGYSSTYIAAT